MNNLPAASSRSLTQLQQPSFVACGDITLWIVAQCCKMQLARIGIGRK